MCQSSSTPKMKSKEKVLIESLKCLVEAKVKILMLVQSAVCPRSDGTPVLKDSPDMPLELAVASVRNIVGVIQYMCDPASRRGNIYLFFSHSWVFAVHFCLRKTGCMLYFEITPTILVQY